MQRQFKGFPKNDKCKVCGTNDDKPCVLVGIDGTSDGHIEEAIPIHVDCVKLRFNSKVNVLYQSLRDNKSN